MLGFTVHPQRLRGTLEESFVWQGLPRSLLQKTAKCLRPFQTKRNTSETVQLKILKKQESQYTKDFASYKVLCPEEPNFSAEE